MSKTISLYRKIDDFFIKQMKISEGEYKIAYYGQEKEILLSMESTQDKYLYINEHDPQWNPDLDDILISISFTIENTSILFGQNGITDEKNKLGIASKVYSKQSNFQEVLNHQLITSDQNETEVKILLEYPKSYFRGLFSIEILSYLSELNVKRHGQADQVGMIVSKDPLYSLTIYVDGDGSIFPITEFSEPKGTLWRFEKNWASADEDVFDSTNVRLALNTAHPLFNQIKKGKTRISVKLMDNIIAQFISLVIQQVILVEDFSIEEADTSVENSILKMVAYWVTTYNIDTSTIYSITNSVNKNMDSTMSGGNIE